MKTSFIRITVLVCAVSFHIASAQITFVTKLPKYVQGVNGTNNNRTPFIFWGTVSGLTPGATYRYFNQMDTVGSPITVSGAGNPYLINMTSGTITRTTSPGMATAGNYEEFTASATGTYSGWFMLETTGNPRFTPGKKLIPKLMLNNGAGGTTIATRVAANDTTNVIDYGTGIANGSALKDTTIASPKTMVYLYDNVAGTGQPIASGIVENDGLDLSSVSSIATWYKNEVDGKPNKYGVIIPNNLPNGIRRVEFRDFSTGNITSVIVDADGNWNSGANTVNMTSGTTVTYLNSLMNTGHTISNNPMFIPPATISSMANDSASAPFNFHFIIKEDGDCPDFNTTPSILNSFVIKAGAGNDITDWTQLIHEAVFVPTGSSTAFPLTIKPDSLVFAPTSPVTILDNSVSIVKVKIWLKTSLGGTLPTTVDGQNIAFKIDNSCFNLTGTYMMPLNSPVQSGAANNAISVVASKLRFTTQPSPTGVQGSPLAQSPVVESTDANNNRDLDHSLLVTLTNTASLPMVNHTATAVSGVATFSNLTFNAPGTTQLNANSGSLTTPIPSITVVISPLVNLHQNLFSGSVDVYPNPVSDLLQLQLREPLKNAQIELISALGTRIILHTGDLQAQNYVFSTDNLPNGIYQLVVTDKSTCVYTQKVSILH
ncbi:MAG: T9SS type A sorting domain-containing protein [Bacteroidia bacterium]|nr:T9SS type A sorting domain-containing protein [Bacteroidia bacterium]MDW8303043.1 T9SS type A sorting domain-containing protein [Bacteroidia bacterium]